ncbi:hypothetical protein PDESU_04048 [Pontiella desulfatans]|uniref:PEP-CTERM protein-sorting domain-containing protein n=1 Tax=Pontiella desulfatans TaxID=2750659 RepID=A0A6C2U6B4_PONDE|nr:PEP-CTERM sorting domain-containing protein [Pontiella desulfatans]VGO15465.1 hypothetical protein PDESU_04048 [Pontiella desulfatans]
MKSISVFFVALSVAWNAHAGFVDFRFEGDMSPQVDSIWNASVSDITFTGTGGGNSQLAQFITNTGTTNNGFAVEGGDTGVRGNADDNPFTSAYFAFTISVNSGYQLDTSSMNWRLDLENISKTGANERSTYGIFASLDGGGTWTNLWNNATSDNNFQINPGTAANNDLTLQDGTTVLQDTTHYGSFNTGFMDRGNLGVLADGQDVMFAYQMGDTEGAGGGVYNLYDSIRIGGIEVVAVPEPASIGLVLGMGGTILFIRRRLQM